MTNTRNDPAAAYKAAANDIARLIDVLQMELERHAEGARAKPGDWGFAGDLGQVRGDLIDTVAFISGRERADIEAFLADE